MIDLYNKEKNKKFDCNKKQIIEAFETITDFVKDMRKNNMYLSDKERLAFEELDLYIKDSTPNQEIRERIKELQELRDENADEIKKNIRFYSIYDSYNLQISELQDLLEEE